MMNSRHFMKTVLVMLGEKEASDTTAKAGYSENQTGLALDFTDTATGTSSVDFANTPAW